MTARFQYDEQAVNFDCDKCGPDHRKHRNCDGKSNPKFRWAFSGHVVDRCPGAVITRQSIRWIRDHWRYHPASGGGMAGIMIMPGHLPRAGGTGDQDNRFMQAMDILDGETAEIRARAMKKAMEKAKHGKS